MKIIVGDYSITCELGGSFDDFDEIPDEETMKLRALERLVGELSDLVLKRPFEEFAAEFSVELENVREVEVDE